MNYLNQTDDDDPGIDQGKAVTLRIIPEARPRHSVVDAYIAPRKIPVPDADTQNQPKDEDGLNIVRRYNPKRRLSPF